MTSLVELDVVVHNFDNYVMHNGRLKINGKNLFLPLDISEIIVSASNFGIKCPVMEVISIYVAPENRNKGLASKALETLVTENQDKLIIVAAGFHSKEYPGRTVDELTPSEWKEMQKRLGKFYTRCNFSDIEEYFGENEYTIMYLYRNQVGLDFLKYLAISSPQMYNISTDPYVKD